MADSWLIDANVILRMLTGDHPDHARAARGAFERAERGELRLVMSVTVVAEIVHVLGSKRLYDLEAQAIRELLRPILRARGMRVIDLGLIERALDRFVAFPELGFGDALHASLAQGETEGRLLSFDRGFDRLPDIRRAEPPGPSAPQH
jgi:predicted nucleic acid-binding protein